MRIISVVDNMSGTSFNYSKLVKRLDRPDRHFLSEHGLSILVETDEGKRVLVDTGASPTVFEHNLSLLGFKPSDIDAVFISHGHYDHMGGLVSMIDAEYRSMGTRKSSHQDVSRLPWMGPRGTSVPPRNSSKPYPEPH